MQRILDDLSEEKVGRPIFISLSIAPMFPHGFAHSRRISCDVFANIGASEYLLNSQNYGWWPAGRLYSFNDPDSTCAYQALGEQPTTEAEARTRFTASVISGGMMIESDDLLKPEARARVLKVFSNREALDLAKLTPQFRPVRGDTRDKAGDQFVYQSSPNKAFVAAFNYGVNAAKRMSIDLKRLGLGSGKWMVHDLWTGKDLMIESTLDLVIQPMDCSLLLLSKRQ